MLAWGGYPYLRKFPDEAERREWLREGCLSVPGSQGEIERYAKVSVKALDLSGKIINFEASGLLAEIVQHEIDHLNGALYIDKARNIKSNEKGN